MTEPSPEPDAHQGRIRSIAAVALAVIAVLLGSMAVDAFWLHQRIFNTDNFVESLAPLPQDPAVSTAIATRTVEVLSAGGTAESKVADILPDRLAFLAPDVFDVVEEKVFDATVGIVGSEAFARVWMAGLETVHAAIIGILDGDPDYPATGDVGLRLEGTAGLVLEELDKRGLDLFEEIETTVGEIAFVQAEMLATPRSLVNVLHTGVWVLPIAALVVLGLAVLVDRDRLRPVQVFGFGLAIAILVSLIAIRLFADYASGRLENEVYREAATSIWDALLNGYLLISAIVGFAALTIGVVAWWIRRPDPEAETPALVDVSLSIPAGGTLALVGLGLAGLGFRARGKRA